MSEWRRDQTPHEEEEDPPPLTAKTPERPSLKAAVAVASIGSPEAVRSERSGLR